MLSWPAEQGRLLSGHKSQAWLCSSWQQVHKPVFHHRTARKRERTPIYTRAGGITTPSQAPLSRPQPKQRPEHRTCTGPSRGHSTGPAPSAHRTEGGGGPGGPAQGPAQSTGAKTPERRQLPQQTLVWSLYFQKQGAALLETSEKAHAGVPHSTRGKEEESRPCGLAAAVDKQTPSSQDSGKEGALEVSPFQCDIPNTLLKIIRRFKNTGYFPISGI